MIVKKTVGSIIQRGTVYAVEKGLLDIFIPKTTVSNRWKHWKATIDFKTCATMVRYIGWMNTSSRNRPYIHFADV